MTTPDSDLRFHPQLPDVDPRSGWVPILDQLKSLPEDSIGNKMLPQVEEVLRNRLRPATTLAQPVSSFWGPTQGPTKSRALEMLQQHGLRTVLHLLVQSEERIRSFTDAKAYDQIQERLRSYLLSLAISPHGQLLAKVLGEEAYPVPLDREGEVISLVEARIAELRAKGRWKNKDLQLAILADRFGLADGIIKTYEELAQKHGVTRGQTTLLWAQAEDKFLHFGGKIRSETLLYYIPIPEKSFGRYTFGAVFAGELPTLDGIVEDLNMFEHRFRELRRIKRFWYGGDHHELRRYELSDLIRVDFSRISITPETWNDIDQRLRIYHQRVLGGNPPRRPLGFPQN